MNILDKVIHRYLNSGDYNGYHVGSRVGVVFDQLEVAELISFGLIELVDENDYPNPHIRPWHSKYSVENQIERLNKVMEPSNYGVCLYPTEKALAQVLPSDHLLDKPYERRIASGGGVLEPAFFKLDALEVYREDPRFDFKFGDFGFDFNISDEIYDDDNEKSDRVALLHGGFAYDKPGKNLDSNTKRRACIFLTDLRRFTPEHQQRWATFEVSKSKSLKPHPIWFSMQMGHWPDGMGPLERMKYEFNNTNDLFNRAYGINLFSVTELPREFGWILRTTQREYDNFITLFDKLLSENISHIALDRTDTPRLDEHGQVMGTIRRLEIFIRRCGCSELGVKKLISPLRDIRKARQDPAHTIRANVTDQNALIRQVDLLGDVNFSLRALRFIMQQHPKNLDWSEEDYLKDATDYRM